MGKLEKMQKLLDPNSNKYSNIISNLAKQTKEKNDYVFVKFPKGMETKDKEKLLKWYRFFGNKNYKYSLSNSEESIMGELLNNK